MSRVRTLVRKHKGLLASILPVSLLATTHYLIPAQAAPSQQSSTIKVHIVNKESQPTPTVEPTTNPNQPGNGGGGGSGGT